ncbi:MAG TPA: hypothetical protein VFX51_03240 [Solirubrobacteraceae bacterium]|nr:hypothetical protein [Solirubrobacteraceae bacterium]
MSSCQRARWAVLLTCGALLATVAPASAHTRDQDAVALARTLADGFTAIDARRPQAQAAVDAWLADQGRCAEPTRIRSRFRRSTFTAVRWTGLHIVALHALAPELEQLAQRLRVLPVTDGAIRGGIREVLLDYRNARQLMKAEPPDLCAVVRSLRRGEPWAKGIGYSEDVRGSIRGLDRRAQGLRAAQRALLNVEVDPRLARSLDAVFEHATAGLYRSRLQTREHLAPPFAIVTDPAELARLRTEAGQLAATTETLAAARGPVSRRLEKAFSRVNHCQPAVLQAARHRPVRTFGLVTSWIFGEFAAATAEPAKRFRADVNAVHVADPLLAGVAKRASRELELLARVPRVDICGEVRAWRRAGWPRGGGDVVDDIVEGGVDLGSGLELEQDVIDRAVLRRRGVSREATRALIDPLAFLLEALETSSGRSTRSLRATALQALR